MSFQFSVPAGRGWLRLLVFLVCLPAVMLHGAVVWEPIPAEQRSATAPASEPEAVAEIVDWRVDLTVKSYKATQKNLQRIKIYSERAIEELGKLGVEYTESEKITDLAARVVHADGSVTELPENQFQSFLLDRVNHARRMAKRLVVPRLAVGDIVELQWRSDEDGRFRGSRFIYCQQTIPVRRYEFTLRNSASGLMNLATFGAPEATIEGHATTRGRVVIKNLPSYVEEPDMPPAFNVRAALLVLYGAVSNNQAESWGIGEAFLKALETVQCGVTKEVQRVAGEVVRPQDFREDQLRALYAYCQERIANIAYDEAPASLLERTEYHAPRRAGEVLRVGRGNALEINCLFAALARAAGFEVRLTYSADCTEVLSVQFSHGWYFMKTSGVLVRVGGEWRLFAPGERAVPFGASRWQREGSELFYIENSIIHWENVLTTYERQARRVRTGRLVLEADGALEGDVIERLEGQEGIAWREEHWNAAPPTWERLVGDAVRRALPEAEVSAVAIDNLLATGEPLVLRYHLRLPNYATTVGDRLAIVPSLFDLHATPRYTATERRHAIWWKYPRRQLDEFDFVLPTGYELEAPAMPGPVQDSRGILAQTTSIARNSEQNVLHYRRELAIGRTGTVTFDETSYPVLRALFEQINAARTHSLLLRKIEPVAAASAP